MRINELTNVTWEDIDLKRRLIYVRPKDGFSTKTDNSERAIPINTTLLQLLSSAADNKSSSIYSFCSIKGSKLRDRRLLEACKEIGHQADIKGRLFLHKWRHTFATTLVQRGVRIEVIQKLLGHASIKETMIYAHVNSEKLHDEVAVLDDLIEPNMPLPGEKVFDRQSNQLTILKLNTGEAA